jgi:glucose/arabinose dehydrogenase
MRKTRLPVLLCLLAFSLAGCGDEATLPEEAGVGPNPKLPPPKETLIPTVNIAPHKGWPAGGKPTPAAGLSVAAYAVGLNHPRWLYVLPNGDVLVAESNTPRKPDGNRGIGDIPKKVVLWLIGAGVPSPDRITLLRDADGDGVAEEKSTFLSGLNSPFGMALVGETLYVANTDALLRFPYREGETKIDAKPEKVADLPAGPINLHWTKNVIASADGAKL